MSEDVTPLESESIYTGRIVDLKIEKARFPDGSTGELEMIRHSGAAAVLPVLGPLASSDPEILLVRQFRYAAGGYLLEVPAGRPEQVGEDWEQCARRELAEETGYTADRLVRLTSILTTPGFTDERIHLFLAADLTPGRTNPDVDEFIEPVALPLSEAIELIRENRISDAKTICTILFAKQFLLG